MDLHAARRPPTLEEFEGARNRELARLNVRLSSLMDKLYHTPKDLELLEDDTEQQRSTDMETVRLWSANAEKYGGGTKST